MMPYVPMCGITAAIVSMNMSRRRREEEEQRRKREE